jgi:hypothetical protein
MSASTSSGHAPKGEIDVMGHKRSIAPQQTAPWFDPQPAATLDLARSNASTVGIGSSGPAREITDETARLIAIAAPTGMAPFIYFQF